MPVEYAVNINENPFDCVPMLPMFLASILGEKLCPGGLFLRATHQMRMYSASSRHCSGSLERLSTHSLLPCMDPVFLFERVAASTLH